MRLRDTSLKKMFNKGNMHISFPLLLFWNIERTGEELREL